MSPSDIERFWSKVDQKDIHECWEWQAAKLVNGGYGAFRCQGKTLRAHVVMYQLRTGYIPEGHVIGHACNNPACVNPYHLIAFTQADNMRHKSLAGRAKGSPVNSKSKFSNEELHFIATAPGSLRSIARALGRNDHHTINRIRQAIQSGELLYRVPKQAAAE